jgi:hypothetical protein
MAGKRTRTRLPPNHSGSPLQRIFGNQFFPLPGTDVMIFKIFSQKKLAKKMAFFAQTTDSFWKNCDHNIVF